MLGTGRNLSQVPVVDPGAIMLKGAQIRGQQVDSRDSFGSVGNDNIDRRPVTDTGDSDHLLSV